MSAKPKFLLRETYLAAIKGSIGSKMFRESHFKINGKDIDVLEKGNLSCAYFVMSILKIFDLVHELHTTVNGAEKDMLGSGWKDIKRRRTGCVIIYAPRDSGSGVPHRHMAFYVGNNMIVHNVWKRRVPGARHWAYRPIERLLWHPKLKP